MNSQGFGSELKNLVKPFALSALPSFLSLSSLPFSFLSDLAGLLLLVSFSCAGHDFFLSPSLFPLTSSSYFYQYFIMGYSHLELRVFLSVLCHRPRYLHNCFPASPTPFSRILLPGAGSSSPRRLCGGGSPGANFRSPCARPPRKCLKIIAY